MSSPAAVARSYLCHKAPTSTYMERSPAPFTHPLRGVSLCGVCTHPGGSVIGINGRDAGPAVLEGSPTLKDLFAAYCHPNVMDFPPRADKILLGLGTAKIDVRTGRVEPNRNDVGRPLESRMESVNHCAYNLDRESFLGAKVDAADFSDVLFQDRIRFLTSSSGAALWMIPFRGIPVVHIPIRLDLAYLDQDCRVIETVESFPDHLVSPFSRPAVSVLVLPVGTLRASQTTAGDRILICPASEMEYRLEAALGAGIGGRGLCNGTSRGSRPEAPSAGPPLAVPSARSRQESEASPKKKRKSWLERFLSPDPPGPADLRKAPRKTVPGLCAYFWTGATPEPHAVRDISRTGLYLVTEERWYPGTMIRLMLTNTGPRVIGALPSISVQAKSVRWGNDGVGLQFVVQGPGASPIPGGIVSDGANREQLDLFLEQLKSNNG